MRYARVCALALNLYYDLSAIAAFGERAISAILSLFYV